uniref:Uncharacterized protein n=1 Tax=Anopheles darlingi TaxID=43151 RepID=A0A2M4DGN6_ANODA
MRINNRKTMFRRWMSPWPAALITMLVMLPCVASSLTSSLLMGRQRKAKRRERIGFLTHWMISISLRLVRRPFPRKC